jgi:regulator of PEP synthase PpsR (kinase-PPPase family)
MPHRRSAFFVSDRTGLTAESLGYTLLTQFDMFDFKRETIPFVDTVEKAQAVAARIRDCASRDQHRPLVFSSIVNAEVREAVKVDCALCIDFFESFIDRIEHELHQKAALSVGKAHGVVNEEKYDHRIEAVNYSLNHDDGVKPRGLDQADVILIGVSRSGKTPTSLYLALQYGIKAANYPLTPEDLGQDGLPEMLLKHRQKLFGLTIEPMRLHQIRTERRRDSTYASLDNCRNEIARAETLFRQHNIPFIPATHKSIEEIAVTIMTQAGLARKF